jgi:predicted NAD/FAD-binding protein
LACEQGGGTIMKIAIIGSGIAGLTAAHLLHEKHDITVYEAANYIGGHVNSIDVDEEHQSVTVDTGFIVFNDWTYPSFEKLLSELKVEVQNSEMSFSAQCEATGFEWSGNGLRGMVFNKDNWWQYKSYQIFFDMLRFNKEAKRYLKIGQCEQTIKQFLVERKYSTAFIDFYIVPMGAAIWSSDVDKINQFPAMSFLSFFNQHGLLNINHRPQWKTIVGGSRQYVKQLTKPFLHNIHINSPVEQVKRVAQGIEIMTKDCATEFFDHVFIACHSDQALKILEKPTALESEVLGNIHYQANTAVLHTDKKLMPSRKADWSSWNYFIAKQSSENVKLTYYMNRLQKLATDHDYFVTLNDDARIDPDKIIRTIDYMHPVFDHSAITAQKQHAHINGTKNTWYCGAYWRNGFHEDGVWSAEQSVKQFVNQVDNEELYLQRAS